MKTNNALVTWNELDTMGLVRRSGNPPTGNKIVTKGDIEAYYYMSTTSIPYIYYTTDRCPRYQDILSAGVPTTVQSYGYSDYFTGECYNDPGQYETQRTYIVVFNTPATTAGYLYVIYDDTNTGIINFYQGDDNVNWFSNCGCINPCLTIVSVTVFPS
jgi:hypothetical protein